MARTTKKPANPARKAAQAAVMAQNRATHITLTMRHVRNGRVYGPGPATVPLVLANDLLANEAVARQQEESFRGTKSAIIGGRTAQGAHRIIPVPGETFDDSLAGALPFTTIKGGD